MISDWELWSCANQMITEHGDDAWFHAAMKADALMEAGDMEGSRTWAQIVRRVTELQKMAPEGASIN